MEKLCSLAKQHAMHNTTPVENLFILEYMLKAPSDYVKVYVYALMQCYYPSYADSGAAEFARALGMEEAVVNDAFAYWLRQGILRKVGDEPPRYEFDNVYDSLLEGKSVKEVKLYQRAELNSRIQALFGKRYFRDFDKVYDWIEVFGLPEDVALRMIEYCISLKGPSVRINYLDTVARDWANSGVGTLEEAEAKILDFSLQTSEARKVLTHIGINRLPSVDEYKLYEKWSAWGYSLELIKLACSDMTRIQKPNFAYVNKILTSWHEAGVATREEALAALSDKPGRDAKRRPNEPESFMQSQYRQYNAEALGVLEDDIDQESRAGN